MTQQETNDTQTTTLIERTPEELKEIRTTISYDLIMNERDLADASSEIDFDLDDYEIPLKRVSGKEEYFDDYVGSSLLALKCGTHGTKRDEAVWEEVSKLVDGETAIRPYSLNNEYINETDLPTIEVETFNPSSKKKVIKEWKQHRTDIDRLVYTDYSTTRRDMTIDYSKIFSREIPEYLMTYNVDQKSYSGIMDKIENDFNFLLNEYPELALKFLAIRSRSVKEGKEYDTESYLLDIISLISDIKLRSIVYGIIDDTYTISLDLASKESNRRIIEDLQLTDHSNKCLLAIAFLCRITIPITSQYVHEYSDLFNESKREEKDRFSRLCLTIFEYITKFVSYENGVNLVNKLYKIVEPRVKGTNYSNKVIWRFLIKHTMDDDTAIYKYINTIIRTIIPKLNPNSSTISFLDVVIRRMLDCDFKVNYALTFKTFNVSSGSDEDTNEIDIVSANTLMKHNELTEIANELTINTLVEREFKKYGITQEQVDFVYDKISFLNELQVRLLEMFYYGKIEISKFSRSTVAKLLLIMYYCTKNESMIYLPKLILGQVKSDSADVRRGNSRVYAEVLNSKNYQDIRSQYSIAQEKFDRDSGLLKLSSVYAYDFMTFDPVDFTTSELTDIDKKILANEIFSFKLIL